MHRFLFVLSVVLYKRYISTVWKNSAAIANFTRYRDCSRELNEVIAVEPEQMLGSNLRAAKSSAVQSSACRTMLFDHGFCMGVFRLQFNIQPL